MRGLYKESHYMQKHVVWASSLSLGLEFRALNPEPLHTLSPKDSKPPTESNRAAGAAAARLGQKEGPGPETENLSPKP